MNIRDVVGFDSAKELYELASDHRVHASSMEPLVRFAFEIQRRALADRIKREAALDRMVAENERLGLYEEPVVEIRVLGEAE